MAARVWWLALGRRAEFRELTALRTGHMIKANKRRI